MSLPPPIQCRAGCGARGEPEIEFLCIDCHADRQEILKQKMLREELEQKRQGNSKAPPKKRGPPPKIDYGKGKKEYIRSSPLVDGRPPDSFDI